jgi:hypothetical protein
VLCTCHIGAAEPSSSAPGSGFASAAGGGEGATPPATKSAICGSKGSAGPAGASMDAAGVPKGRTASRTRPTPKPSGTWYGTGAAGRTPMLGVLSSPASAPRTASSMARSTPMRSRKRTSALAGCTFTSTSPSGTSRKRKREG